MAQSFEEKAHLNINHKKYADGWERIFGKKSLEVGNCVIVTSISGFGDNSYFGTIVKIDGDVKVMDNNGVVRTESVENVNPVYINNAEGI
jgi:hypothetical protein